VNRDNPFDPAPGGKRHIATTNARTEALARLGERFGRREPFVLVTGESGSGKTLLVAEAAAAWEKRGVVARVCNPALSPAELLEEVTRRFGAEPPPGASKPQLIACLEALLTKTGDAGKVAVLVVDDAHELSIELLSELRAMANIASQAGRAFEIVLVGLPEIETTLADPALASLKQRVSVHCRTRPFTLKETKRYLQQTVSTSGADGPRTFPADTCKAVFGCSGGIPRAVTVLAAAALDHARAGKSDVVTEAHVKAVAANTGVAETPRQSRPEPKAAPVAAKPSAKAPKEEPKTEAAPAPAKAAATESPAPAKAESEVRATSVPDDVAEAPPSDAPSPASEAVASSDVTPVADEPSDAAEPVVSESGEAEHPFKALMPRTVTSTDPRVSEWVARFIAEDEPRFGTRLQMAVLGEVEAMVVTKRARGARTASATEAPGYAADAEADPEFDDVPDVHPRTARRHPAHPRPGHGARSSDGARLAGIAVVTVVLAALAVIVLLPRMRGDATTATAAHTPTTPAVADSATTDEGTTGSEEATPQPKETKRPAETAPKREPVARPQATESRAAPAAVATAGETAPATPPPPIENIALDVGSYINPERAEEERTRLAAESGLQAWIVEGEEYGATTYKVVLGIFSSRERAQRSAAMLLERGAVSQALVIPLPPRSKRH